MGSLRASVGFGKTTNTRITWIYDEAGRVVEQRFHGVDQGVSGSIYSCDHSGRLLRTVNVDEKGTRSESETYHYDSGGRKTRKLFLPKIYSNGPYSYDVEGAEGLIMSGTAAKTTTTSYDDHDQPPRPWSMTLLIACCGE